MGLFGGRGGRRGLWVGSTKGPLAPQGSGSGEVLATFPPGREGNRTEVDVAGLRHHWAAACAIAGRRPRDDVERGKTIKVRLVREPDNPHDPNAIAVVSDNAGQLGYIPREFAAELAPGIDDFLRTVAAKRETSGQAVDFYCSAEVLAAWLDLEDLDPEDDKYEPDSVDVTLWFDPKWTAKLRRRS